MCFHYQQGLIYDVLMNKYVVIIYECYAFSNRHRSLVILLIFVRPLVDRFSNK